MERKDIEAENKEMFSYLGFRLFLKSLRGKIKKLMKSTTIYNATAIS